MGSEYILGPNGELYHWGIKGQKWGIRRYQNKDGSLTALGRKRRKASGDGDVDDAPTTPKKAKRTSVSDMSDDDLVRAINRARLEDAYKQLRPDPQPKKGAFAEIKDNVIKPAVMGAGKKFVAGALDKAVEKVLGGKVDPNSLEAIEKANKKMEAQIKNRLLKRGINPDFKAENLEKWRNFIDEDDNRKNKQNTYDDEMRKYREYNDNWYENDNATRTTRGESTYSSRGGERTDTRGAVSPSQSLVVRDYAGTPATRTNVARGMTYTNNYTQNDARFVLEDSATGEVLRRYS